MTNTADLCLMTATWAGDAEHFALLQTSLAASALATLPHHVVVQSEDMHRFGGETNGQMQLHPTADLLPGDVERRRRQALTWHRRLGRSGSKSLTSLALRTGRPRWVRYLGWQVQQISKLAFAAASPTEHVLVLDSDVIVTPQARVDDYLQPTKVVCVEHWQAAEQVRGKTAKWNRQAHHLLEQPFDATQAVDCYFDTPFPLHAPTVRALLAWLESRYQKPWWEVLLAQPPRRWSEFATYRLYLRRFCPPERIAWRAPALMRYLYDASEPAALRDQLQALLVNPDCHYVTIHSQASGRQLWSVSDYAPLIRPLLTRRD